MKREKRLKITVTSAYPSPDKRREGMMERIKSIDNILQTLGDTNYLSISFRKNIIPSRLTINNNTTEINLNFFLHQIEIYKEIKKSDIVYVHSIATYLMALFAMLLRSDKVILDLHGVVPEETELVGKKFLAAVYRITERVAMKYSRAIIVVTRNMGRHLNKKYNINDDKIIYLPIYNESYTKKSNFNARPVFIYAGGLQKWQNFDMIAQLIKKYSDSFRFEIYVPQQYLPLVNEKIPEGAATVGSLSKEELEWRYLQADVGILIREDNIINNVANPTKLNEYLAFGLVPLMLTNNVGDFQDSGFQSFSYHDDLKYVVNLENLQRMSHHNETLYLQQRLLVKAGIDALIRRIELISEREVGDV